MTFGWAGRPAARWSAGRRRRYREAVPDLDLLDLLIADHENLSRTGPDGLLEAVLQHIWVERELLYPAIAEHLQGGEAVAEGLRQADDGLEEELAGLEPAAEAAAVGRVREALAGHVNTQEALFPSLRDSIPAEVLVDLADGVPLAIGGAPTRPRPRAREGLLGELSDDVAAATDHLRGWLHRKDAD